MITKNQMDYVIVDDTDDLAGVKVATMLLDGWQLLETFATGHAVHYILLKKPKTTFESRKD